jgi:mannose-1-phosphate guanylyltransferase
VAKFVEKPDPETAASYIKAGYFWNSGNFMFRASVLLDEYRSVDATSVQAVSDAVTRAEPISASSSLTRTRSDRRRRFRSTTR